MKKKILIAVMLIVTAGIMNTLNAQADTLTNKKIVTKQKSWLCSNFRVEGTNTGCNIVFDYEVKSPRDAANGQATGKRQYKPMTFAVDINDNSVTDASALKMKARHDVALNSICNLKGKIKMQASKVWADLLLENDSFTLPRDCEDGDYDLVFSWDWEVEAENKSMQEGKPKTPEVYFTITIKGGVCEHAINTKGTGSNKDG